MTCSDYNVLVRQKQESGGAAAGAVDGLSRRSSAWGARHEQPEAAKKSANQVRFGVQAQG